MPRRKKLPPFPDYTDGGRTPGTHLIQKSNPLLSLSETDMTLPELKILDVYLDRIDSHDDSKRTVQFEKGEIERMLGVSRILKNDLEMRLRHLAQVVRIEDGTTPDGFKLIALFEAIEARRDEDGLWQIILTCTNQAREYIFNIENLGYLRYRLKNVIGLTSRYSYVLYLWLEHNRFRRSWETDLDELKSLLRCTAETYAQYKRFNDLVLKRCYRELTEKTTLRYSYEPVRRGRKVCAVRFTVETMPPELPGQISMDGFPPGACTPDDHIELLRSACTPEGSSEPEFSRPEMEQLWSVLVTVDDSKLPWNVPAGSEDLRQYHYLAEKYAAMCRVHIRKPIKHRFAYMLKMLKADAGTA